MKRTGFAAALLVGMAMPFPASADLSFTGTYSRSQTTEEEIREIDGLTIIYPADQGDLLSHLIPLITRHEEERSRTAREEAAVIREVIVEQEHTVAKAVKTLLSQDALSDSFSTNYEAAVQEVGNIIDGWEIWSSGFSRIHFYNRATAAPFWNEQKQVLDFGETKYSFKKDGGVNLAILPPFVAQFGAGVDKLKTDPKDVEEFQWDIGLFAPPGVSAEAAAKDIATLFPVLSNLQSGVAKQIAVKWIRYYLIERMLQQEIEITYFDGKEDSRYLSHGLARLYLFGFLNQVESKRMNVLLPNLVHFPLPEESPREFIAKVESLDPLNPIAPGMETPANRVLMYGLLKASQRVEGDFLPLQFIKEKGIAVPEGGFDSKSFALALHEAYSDPHKDFADAAHEIATLMRTNFLASKPTPEAIPQSPETSRFPESYQQKTYGDLSITAPSSLIEAMDQLGPKWNNGLKEAVKVLKQRFDREPVPAIPFGKEDFEGLRRYGIKVKPSDVEVWLLQTAVTNNVEQAFTHLFDGNEIEIWFKDDLVDSLRGRGNTELFSWNEATGKVTANFSFTIPPELFRGATVEELLQRYDELEPPVLPIVVTDREVEKGTVEDKIAAILKGDYIVEKLIDGAEQFSPGELDGPSATLLDEKETFFVVIHEVTEGYLIQSVIASPDRRWFCDGLANWIAMRECDRRFGDGTGKEVMSKMFPPKVSDSLANQINLLGWKAIETEEENIAVAEGLDGAHYDYATRAIEKALSARDPEFVRHWIEQIRKTKWIRTNASTVIKAYDQLSDGNLREIIETIAE